MSPVTIIPTPLATASAAARNPRNAGTVGLFFIGGRLGKAHYSVPRLVRLIDAMIEHEDFPAPFPTWSGGRMIRGAHKDSSWPQLAVHCWFNDRLPPQARDVLAAAERTEIDTRLARCAADLFSGDAA